MTASRAITEAELLEIEQRYRRLEAQIRRADGILAERERYFVERIARADADLHIPEKYDSTCRIIHAHERERDRIVETRAALERAAELCREDLRTLVDRERGR